MVAAQPKSEGVVKAFEDCLAAEQAALKAKDDKALTAAAKNGLELVDDLEKVFKK